MEPGKGNKGPTFEILLQVYKPLEAIFINIINNINYIFNSLLVFLQKKRMSNGDWMCSSCQHLNFKKRETCQRCRYPKFGGGSDMSPYTIAKNEILAGDWYCNAINCGAHNYASRPSCYRCGNVKNEYCNYIGSMMDATACMYDNSALPGWKSGDWVCNRLGCGGHNYASKMECFKCRTPRDFGATM